MFMVVGRRWIVNLACPRSGQADKRGAEARVFFTTWQL